MYLTCPNPDGSGSETVDMNTSGSNDAGVIESQYPTMNARRVITCFADAQQSIAEGRARGIKPFNILGATIPGI